MNHLLLVLLAVHILVCTLCAVLTWLGILKSPGIDVFILLMIPVFGLGSLLIHSRNHRNIQPTTRKLGLDGLMITDPTRKSIFVSGHGEDAQDAPLSEALTANDAHSRRQIMKDLFEIHTGVAVDEDVIQEKVVPIQEALLLNDVQTKRELILDVLYTNPSGYVSQLSQARENEDSEVVHYAVTALVEIQKNFEQQFQEMGRKLAENPDDEILLRNQQRLLEQYLSSGLLEGSRADEQLWEYLRVLKKRLCQNPESFSLWMKKADADMRLKNLEDLREDAQRMMAIRKEDERGYRYLLKYYALCKDAEGVQGVIKTMLEQKKLYLSPEGRSEVAFWRREKTGGMPK